MKIKKALYKVLLDSSKDEENVANRESYKMAKKIISKPKSRAISKPKSRACENLYQIMENEDGEKDIFNLVMAKEWKARYIDQVYCIKNGV